MNKLFSFLLVIGMTPMAFGQTKIALNIGQEEQVYKSVTDNQIKFKKNQKVNDVQTCEFKFKQVNATDSTKGLEFVYEALTCSKKKKDSTTVLDTKHPRYPYAQNMTAVVGKPINLLISTKGQTTDSITGIDSIVAHVYDSFVKLPDSAVVENTKYRIKETYGESNTRSLIEAITTIAPDSLIKKNGTWTCNSQFIANLKANIKTTYQLKNSTESTYEIEGTSEISNGEDSKFTTNGISYKLEELNGTIKSEITLDKNTGLLNKGTYRIEAKAKTTAYNMFGSVEDGVNDEIEINIKQILSKE